MPAKPFCDLSTIDMNNVIADQQAIYALNPHRYEFMLLDGILMNDVDKGIVVGYRDCKEDEFWVRGHIPGRPLFPGVLMIESAAQLVSYFALKATQKTDAFLGFAGVNDVKFRGQVVPGDRLVLIGKMVDVRPRRCVGVVQGYVGDQQVFQGEITGMWI
jgi:3-hydroxyacyl-[acyl-carrier-protein] dehydratase